MELFESTGQLMTPTIVMRLGAASILARFIFLSYWLSHNGSIYSKKFNISLVALTVITTMVINIIILFKISEAPIQNTRCNILQAHHQTDCITNCKLSLSVGRL